jgi:transposase
MQLKLKTILNLKEDYFGFVYKDIRLIQKKDNQIIEIKIEARKGSKGVCFGCGKKCPGWL